MTLGNHSVVQEFNIIQSSLTREKHCGYCSAKWKRKRIYLVLIINVIYPIKFQVQETVDVYSCSDFQGAQLVLSLFSKARVRILARHVLK